MVLKGGIVITDNNEVYDFGLRLAALRKKRGLSQNDVAKRIDVNKATISAYERNITMPSVETLKTLAILYNSSVDYMLGFADRTQIFIDDLSLNQQDFVLDVLKQVRERFSDKETDV